MCVSFPCLVFTSTDTPTPLQRITNSADFFIRGQEVLSGGQRIHHAPLLEQKMKENRLDPEDLKDYVEGFRFGCPPHGGGGIGLERVLMLFLDLGNVRWATLFARDPRSFPESVENHGGKSLRGPQASTLEYAALKRRDAAAPLPRLEDLIAAYGDSTNTSWVDPAWDTWRDAATGAAVGYKQSHGYAIIWGRPLCDDAQLHGVVDAFLQFLKKERKLKAIWGCVDEATEGVLARGWGWRSLVAAAEERVDPTTHNPTSHTGSGNLAKKIKDAKNHGVKVVVVEGNDVAEEVKKEVNQRLEEWRQNRKGKQVHTTGLRPWDDMEHRRYLYAQGSDNKARLFFLPYIYPNPPCTDRRACRPCAARPQIRLANQILALLPGRARGRDRVPALDRADAARRRGVPQRDVRRERGAAPRPQRGRGRRAQQAHGADARARVRGDRARLRAAEQAAVQEQVWGGGRSGVFVLSAPWGVG